MASVYTEDQWAAILALGDEVDARLRAGDVRLTMGGEPTFISRENPWAAEWHTTALGPEKERLAVDLVRRLRRRFAPGGLVHFGQGKWYPGESMPRWAFSLYWRQDGEPLARNPELFSPRAADDGPEKEGPRRFLTVLASRLGLGPDFVLPAYEDPIPFLARAQCLPENVDVLQATLGDPDEFARLARALNHGLTKPVAYVLPIRWSGSARSRSGGSSSRSTAAWRSERWTFKRKRLYLVPGDHPAGHRLPIGSLPLVPADLYPYYAPIDPFEERPPLSRSSGDFDPLNETESEGFAGGLSDNSTEALMPSDEPDAPARTALCAEDRDGFLRIFLPSTESAEEFVALVSAIEDTAAALGLPVRLEGYPPPTDWRLNVIKVTPDPGVLEVNLHPAEGWRQLVDINVKLYEDARMCGLTAEKFMLNGRQIGTGGGNHITIGGPTPADSPFLRRPDLLGSVVKYWQSHPALSYLLSGLFVGPSSQAPRVDEARHEALYELELAFAQVPDPESGETEWPWLVDRLFRNLLIDMTGNTHRAELCIDKLYAPDSAQGRLGLVEFRAFEMPPDARLLLAQRLLIRALIAWLWERPVVLPLVRWGTTLHDAFMLPHFVWKNLLSVTDDLAEAGFAFDPEWLGPQFEWRFPCYGRVSVDGVGIELRQALEPWHVLAEDPASSGTSRPTDSSMDRVQVRVAGFDNNLHVLICNGRRVPLQNTGADGDYVAGVRFRAWDNPSGLHPVLGATESLTFELLDSRADFSLGGCTYSVRRPTGDEYRRAPRNAREAEKRRRERFRPHGPSARKHKPPPIRKNAEFPMTLDLRRG